jgi:hypothetical protein
MDVDWANKDDWLRVGPRRVWKLSRIVGMLQRRMRFRQDAGKRKEARHCADLLHARLTGADCVRGIRYLVPVLRRASESRVLRLHGS